MYDDDFEFFGFLLIWLAFLLVVGFLAGLIVNSADKPSPAVEMCVSEKMQVLEGTDFWATESERGAAVDAVERYCWDVS